MGNWVSDQCGATRHDCSCPLGKTCNAATGACCTPTTCSALGKNCGSWPDGCGNTLNCGTCSAPLTCSNGACVCQCSDGTPCGQCAITDTFKPSWCDNNGNWVANQCNAPHNCPCPGGQACNLATSACFVPGPCTCNWNNNFACGISPTTGIDCKVFVFFNAWWKKCVCNQPFCGLCLPEGIPHNTEVCTSNIC
jgi:hypothetical protein